jgi:hypothetical protein
MRHNISIARVGAATVIGLLGCAPTVAAPAGNASGIVKISVYPPKLALSSKRDVRQLVVTGTYADGRTTDLTHSAEVRTSKPTVARSIPGAGIVTAVGDGSASVTVVAGGKSVTMPVTVANTGKRDPVSFKFETMAILTKQGCSTGSCHGSPHGKGGFQLSLFGYDPETDRTALTRDGYSRRINTLDPADSLMIKKPSLQLPHVGGKRLR